MDHQFNFKSSNLFKVNKIVHPATIISVFFRQPVSPAHETALIDLLDFLLNTNLPRDYLRIELIHKQCQKVSPYLKECFPELRAFSNEHFNEFFREFKNNEYRSLFLEHVEEKFGKQLGVIKMSDDHLCQNKPTPQQETKKLRPIDALINAHRPAQIFRLPNFIPPFHLHRDVETKVDEFKKTQLPTAKL